MLVHTHGDWGGDGGAAPDASWAPLERGLWLDPASCQLAGALGAAAAVLPLAAGAGSADAALGFAGAVVDASWAAVAASVRAGAGSPRVSASSRRRVLITPSRDAIWRWSKAIMVCSAVGGVGGGWASWLPPLPPLERERLRVAAPLSMAAGGAPARKGASATPRAVRNLGRCRRAAKWLATPAWSPIVHRARGRGKGETQERPKRKQEDCSSARQPQHVQLHNKRREKHINTA